MKTNMKRWIVLILLIIGFCIGAIFAGIYNSSSRLGCITIATIHDITDEDDASSAQHKRMISGILCMLSQRTGIDFAYLGEIKEDGKIQADMILVHSLDHSDIPENACIPLFSYSSAEETMEISLIINGVIDDQLIAIIKTGAQSISPSDVHSLFNSTASVGARNPMLIVFLSLSIMLILLIFCFVIFHKSQKVIRQQETSKNTDAETGVGNLNNFKQYFAQLCEQPYNPLLYMAYLIIDSDYLQAYHKHIRFNDVLQYTANTLASYPREGEIVARITENSFAFTFQCANVQAADDHVQAIIKRLNRYVSIRHTNNRPVFHAAVYQLNPDQESCELLLMKLRRSCSTIAGSEQLIIHCDTRGIHDVQEEKKIFDRIQKGFDQNEFKLYLQFIVNNASGHITSAEALSRWQHPELGLLLPNQYIESMKAMDLITRLDYHMFELVCRQLEEWNEGELSHIALSCNFTRVTISDQNLPERIQEIASRYSFDHSRLTLEITEDFMEASMEKAMENIHLCKKLCFRIALDDLGSGYTSLLNLCDYPIDTVKLDRNLLLKTTNERGKKLFHSLIDLCHNLNLKVICEGIETEEQRDFILSSQCDDIQGWYYSHPIPVENSLDFIRAHTRRLTNQLLDAATT